MPKPTSGNVSVKLDQWADGPVSQGDFDGTGQTQEVFVNGNLNAQKAHYNEGDAIPYRAILDNLTTGVEYSLVIEWDTVDSGAYALDYLTGYNFSFVDPRHPGEPDVNPLQGVNDVSGQGAQTLAAIQADPILMEGFGAQFGTTDGIDTGAGLPSGAQFISIFGAVSGASVGTVTYNADKTKASVTVTFTYNGSEADNEDAVVVAWGGHIASSLDWADDPGENVKTASDISGSPYHMRVKSLVIDGVVTSIGNQDRSLSADAVLPPIPPETVDQSVIVDEDDILEQGIGDAAFGDDQPQGFASSLDVTNATSVDFADLHGDAVLDTSAAQVKSGGSNLYFYWDSSDTTLYASTNVSTLELAKSTAVLSVALQHNLGAFDYVVSIVGQFDHPEGTGAEDNTEDPNIVIDLTYTAVGDGGTQTTGTLSVEIDDDIPVRATDPAAVEGSVEEDGMSAAITPEATGLDGDDQSEGNPGAGDSVADDEDSGLAASLASLVLVGADGPGTFGVGGLTDALPELYSQGDVVSYAFSDSDSDDIDDTLTATAGAVGFERTVFTLKVNTDGSWAFDLDDQLDHVAGNGENLLLRTAADGSTWVDAIDFSSIVQVTDFDGDTVNVLEAGDFTVTVEDDIPVVKAKSSVVYANASNPTPGGTGVFQFAIGSDERSSFSSSDSDFSSVTLNGTVGPNNIVDPVVTWVSEDESSAVFSVTFDYQADPDDPSLSTATGTLTFDKDNGTYNFALDQALSGFTSVRTGQAGAVFTGYELNSNTTDHTQPAVSVAQLDDDFFVQFSGYKEPGGGTGTNNLGAGTSNVSKNLVFTEGELFFQANSWVSVSGTANGVAGDTMQSGEVLDMDFFLNNPGGFTGATADAAASAIFLRFDLIGTSEDLVVVLKLVSASDPTDITTRAIIIDNNDIVKSNALVPAAYDIGLPLDNNDGVVFIESNDYNVNAGDDYVIIGAQVLGSTEGITGSGVDLVGATGDSGGSSSTMRAFGSDTSETTSEPIKISDIGFVIATANNLDADLSFSVVVVDADGDSTGTQTLNVIMDGGTSLLPTSGDDTFTFTDADADGLLAMVMYNVAAGFVSGADTLDFATAGSGTNFHKVLGAEDSVSDFIAAADDALAGAVQYYFGVVAGNGYLASDADGDGITSIVELAGVTDIEFTDIV